MLVLKISISTLYSISYKCQNWETTLACGWAELVLLFHFHIPRYFSCQNQNSKSEKRVFTLVNPASHKGRNEQTFCPRPHGYGLCQQRLKPWFIVVCRSRSCGTLVGEFCVQALEKSWKCSWGERGDLSQGVILTLLCCSSTAGEPLGHSNEKQRI